MLTSTINFRLLAEAFQLSEIPFKQKIYRSGNFNYLNIEDALHITSTIGLRTYVDFRSKYEIEKQGKLNILKDLGVKWIQLPISGYENDLKLLMKPTPADYANYYFEILEKGEDSINQFLSIINDGLDVPLVYGCYSGKDRTGVVSMILLHILGIPENFILKDYMETSVYLNSKIDFFENNWTKRNISKEKYFQRIDVKVETLSIFNSLVKNKYKTMDSYLDKIDIDKNKRFTIKNKLL